MIRKIKLADPLILLDSVCTVECVLEWAGFVTGEKVAHGSMHTQAVQDLAEKLAKQYAKRGMKIVNKVIFPVLSINTHVKGLECTINCLK